MHIAPCTPDTLDAWVTLRMALWPEYDSAELRAGAAELLARGDAIVLLAYEGDALAGFAEGTLRRDYVNGCETSPVVFLEGIYIDSRYRKRGTARALAARIGEWGRAQGCSEFASDALLDNAESHAFHAAIGFAETERVVYFRREP